MNNCGPFLLNWRWRRFSEDQTMIFKANRSFVLRHCKEMVTVSPALYFVFSQSKNLATKKWQFVSRWRHNGITIAMHHPNWTTQNNKLQHWINTLTETTHHRASSTPRRSSSSSSSWWPCWCQVRETNTGRVWCSVCEGKSSSSLQSETVWDPGTVGGSLEDSHYNQDTYRSVTLRGRQYTVECCKQWKSLSIPSKWFVFAMKFINYYFLFHYLLSRPASDCIVVRGDPE